MSLALHKLLASLSVVLALTLCGRAAAQSGEGTAAATAEESPEYKQTIENALEEYRLGHFEEARSLFEHAHQLDPNARTLRGMGMVEFELRHYVRAAELLEGSLESTNKPLTDEQRKAVAELLARTRQFIAIYDLEVKPSRPGLTIEIDGKPIALNQDQHITLEAGEHTLRVSAPDVVARELTIDVRGGERQTLRIELELKREAPEPAAQEVASPTSGASTKSEKPVPVRPYAGLGIALTSVGGVATIAGTVLGTLAYAMAKDAPTRDSGKADTARTLALAGDVSLGVGIATAATGIVLLMLRERPAQTKRAADARVQLQGSGLRVRF